MTIVNTNKNNFCSLLMASSLPVRVMHVDLFLRTLENATEVDKTIFYDL